MSAPALARSSRSSRSGLGGHAFRMTLAGMAQRVTGAIGGVIAAHLLGPSGRGIYAVIVLVGAGGALAATCGLQFWAVRVVAVDADDPRARGVLLRHGWFVLVGVALAASLAMVVLPADLRSSGLVSAALVLANAASLLLLAIPTGRRRTGVTAAALTCGGLAWLAWLGFAVVADVSSPAVVAVGAVLSHVVIAAVCLRGERTVSGLVSGDVAVAHRSAVRSHLAPGLGEVVLLSAFRLDVALVAILASPSVAGIYAVATSLAELLWLVPDAVSTVLLPHIAERPDASVARAMQVALVGMGLMALPILVAPQWIISTIFGTAFRDAAACVPWLVIGALLLGVWKVESAALVARDAGTIRLLSALAALGVVLVGDVVLVPHHGAVGAAWSCAAGYAVAASVVRYETQRLARARMAT